jgi:hypothetical protein
MRAATLTAKRSHDRRLTAIRCWSASRAVEGPYWFAIVRLGSQVIPIPSQFLLVTGSNPSDCGSSGFAGQSVDKTGDNHVVGQIQRFSC